MTSVHVLGNLEQYKAKNDCTHSRTTFRYLFAFSQLKLWEKNRCAITVVTVFIVQRERTLKHNLHITSFHELQELKTTLTLLSDYIYKVT